MKGETVRNVLHKCMHGKMCSSLKLAYLNLIDLPLRKNGIIGMTRKRKNMLNTRESNMDIRMHPITISSMLVRNLIPPYDE